MLLNLDFAWLLVATTKVIHWADTRELPSSLDSRAFSKGYPTNYHSEDNLSET